MDKKENDEQHWIEDAEKEAEAIQVEEYEGDDPRAKHNNEQLNTPLFHMPDSNQRNELKGDDDSQNHGDEIAHAFNGRHKQHWKCQKNQHNRDDGDDWNGFWSYYMRHKFVKLICPDSFHRVQLGGSVSRNKAADDANQYRNR